jgi:hypothetical protein
MLRHQPQSQCCRPALVAVTSLVILIQGNIGAQTATDASPKQTKKRVTYGVDASKNPDGVYRANIDFDGFATTTYKKSGKSVAGTLYNGFQNICYQGTLAGNTITNNRLVRLDVDLKTRPPSQHAIDLLHQYPAGKLTTTSIPVSLAFDTPLQVCLDFFGKKQPSEERSEGERGVCGDDRTVAEFESDDPDYHEYGKDGELQTLICVSITATCNPRVVFNTMLEQAQFIAPTDDATPVANCRLTSATIGPYAGNVVRTVVDDNQLSVTNYTVRGQHILHPGRVIRKIVIDAGHVYVRTEGEGTGKFGLANELLSAVVWSPVDQKLKARVVQREATVTH